MGHFGRRPIRLAWFTVALPGLLLNYLGQAALFLSRPIGSIRNPFYDAIDGPLLIPVMVLATVAAVIASQALISGVFSLTRQAMQLGFWPRVSVVHTSATTEGQIYIPEMNWLLMVASIVLVLEFRTSSGLAAAYGIAVTGTMAITSCLYYLVCRRRWGTSRFEGLAFLVPFLTIDLAFFGANAVKIADGGWFPLVLGVSVFTIMTTWWRGQLELSRMVAANAVPDALFFADPGLRAVPRVRGTAVFMTSSPTGIPNVLLHHLKHNQVLHNQVTLVSVKTSTVPWINIDRALEVQELGLGFFRVIAHVGFMQSPDVPALLARCQARGVSCEQPLTTYYLGRQTLLATGTAPLARWRKSLFTFLARNARPPSTLFNLPPNRVVELGVQIEL
jgi:KUP system potassium uptake protein